MPRMTFEKAFRAEIRQWKLSMEEESLIRMVAACVAIRMNGRKPSDVLPITDRVKE